MHPIDPYTKAFHDSSKTFYTKDFTPLDPAQWPLAWKVTYYKDYARFPKIHFSKQESPLEANLFSLIEHRQSTREFTNEKISMDTLGALLRYSCGEFTHSDARVRRAQPSGGARYPIETYLLVWKDTLDLQPGVYHYNVSQHALDILPRKEIEFQKVFRDQWPQNAACALVYTSVFQRTQMKYGTRGYRFMCIEVGSILQNVYLISQALGLGCVGYGGTHDDVVESIIHADPAVESLITSVLIGNV